LSDLLFELFLFVVALEHPLPLAALLLGESAAGSVPTRNPEEVMDLATVGAESRGSRSWKSRKYQLREDLLFLLRQPLLLAELQILRVHLIFLDDASVIFFIFLQKPSMYARLGYQQILLQKNFCCRGPIFQVGQMIASARTILGEPRGLGRSSSYSACFSCCWLQVSYVS